MEEDCEDSMHRSMCFECYAMRILDPEDLCDQAIIRLGAQALAMSFLNRN